LYRFYKFNINMAKLFKMTKRRVPEKKGVFDQYVQNTTVYLLLLVNTVLNWFRLGLTQAEMDKWEDYKDEWIALYPQYTNLDTRTTAITKRLNLLQKSITNFMMPLLDRFAASTAINVDDRVVFRIPKRDKQPTPRAKITTIPFFDLKQIGGGQFKTRVRTKEDASRASMHPDADAYEIRYIISDTSPDSVNDMDKFSIKKKALDILDVDVKNSGKTMFYCIRWVNLSNPENSGPYSIIQKTTIL